MGDKRIDDLLGIYMELDEDGRDKVEQITIALLEVQKVAEKSSAIKKTEKN